MIYLISNQRSLFKTDLYEEISFDKAKKYLESLSIIEFDTETSGLDPHTKELLTYQLGNREKQFVFDHSSYPVGLFKELFESDRLFLIHNAKFDLKWLYKYDIWPKNIYDTMLAEQVIWLGWGDFRKGIESWEYEDNGYKWPYLVSISDKGNTIYKFSVALQAVSKNRLNLELDKSVRGLITKVGLTPEVIQYAGTDVAHLEDIKESQKVDIIRENLQKAVQLENEFVKCLAYMEFCGVKLDENKWKAKMAKDSAKREEAVEELNNFVINYFNSHKGNIISKTIEAENIIDSQWIHDEEKIKKYGFNFGKISKNQIKETTPKLKEKQYYTRDSGIKEVGLLYCERILTPFPWIQQDLQGDLWNGYNTEPYCTINWSSPKQVIPFLELIGFHLDSFDKKTKKRKKSTDAKTIKSQKNVCPEFANSYIKYKEATKVCSAFGENWLKAINSKTKRIHADYHQLGTDTARLSSGGGDSAVNCQQIPKDAETRACFVSERGNCWISEDYDSQESQILASVTNDPALIELYTTGCRDLHSLTAYMSYSKEIPRDIKIENIKALYPQKRQEAKGIEFAIGYGGDFNTISTNAGIPLEEAKEIYNSYMKGFPGVKKYQDYCRKALIKDGFILMNPITKHRCHIPDWENKYLPVRDQMREEGFWEYYRELKQDPFSEELRNIRDYFKFKADYEKKAINYRIQNRGAMCTKLSGILFFNWIIKNNYQNKVKICIQAHDEWNVEAPKEIANEVANVLQQCMEKGAHPFCPRLPLSSGISYLENNELPDFWIH